MADYINELRTQIIDYVDNDDEHGWLEFHHNGRDWKFPKRAIIWYVFGKMPPMWDILPEYEPFSPPGMKLPLDNRYHTDVVIGAGFDLDTVYGTTPEADALYEAQELIEDEFKELRTFSFTVLSNTHHRKSFSCQVYDYEPKDSPNSWSNNHIDDVDPPKDKYDRLRVVVIPTASIEYEFAVRNADVIITESGGKLAHLAIVSRESGKILLRVKDACTKFPIWSKLYINLNEMTLDAVN